MADRHQFEQGSAVADKPTRGAASPLTCYKQRRWTLSVICTCDRTNLTTLRVESRQFAATAPAFHLPHLHLVPPLEITPFEFGRDFRR